MICSINSSVLEVANTTKTVTEGVRALNQRMLELGESNRRNADMVNKTANLVGKMVSKTDQLSQTFNRLSRLVFGR